MSAVAQLLAPQQWVEAATPGPAGISVRWRMRRLDPMAVAQMGLVMEAVGLGLEAAAPVEARYAAEAQQAERLAAARRDALALLPELRRARQLADAGRLAELQGEFDRLDRVAADAATRLKPAPPPTSKAVRAALSINQELLCQVVVAAAVGDDGAWEPIELVATPDREDVQKGRMYVGALDIPTQTILTAAAWAPIEEAAGRVASFRRSAT